MKILLVTVAGMAKRFSESIGYPCLKCIFHKSDIKESLLWNLLHQSDEFDHIILVGGYKYSELNKTLLDNFADLSHKITLIMNDKFEEFGTGYSLQLGLQKALQIGFDELVFAEGDLYFNKSAFEKIVKSKKNVITYCREPINANKSVVYYINASDKIRYIYDTNHGILQINEPFSQIRNSGQVWKFVNQNAVQDIYNKLTSKEIQGTNLNFVEKYFSQISIIDVEFVEFFNWINCNTLSDFNNISGVKE